MRIFRACFFAVALVMMLVWSLAATQHTRAAIDISQERERVADLRKLIDRAEGTAAEAKAMLPPPPPAVPPSEGKHPHIGPDAAHPDLPAMTDKARGQMVVDDDCPQTDCDIPPPPPLVTDPCPAGSKEERAACWIALLFPERDWDTALAVARWESGHTFDPTICYGFRYHPDPACEGRASGLFQHIPSFWSGRAKSAVRWATGALPAELADALPAELDIWDGWHNAIVTAWLVYEAPGGGWSHFYSCASGKRAFIRHNNRKIAEGDAPQWRLDFAANPSPGGWVKSC